MCTLVDPLDRSGFGIPHLYTRMRLRHVRGFLYAVDSRTVIVRENVCTLWTSRVWYGLDGSDQELLEHTLREVGMDMLVPLAMRVAPTERAV